jgi:cell division septum initiation protein DivIVA
VSDELNDLKIDIALIKKDIRQIERFFNKIDDIVETVKDIIRDAAVQEQLNKSIEQKLSFLERKIEEHTRIDVEARLALKEDIDETRHEFTRELKETTKTISKTDDRTDEILDKMDKMMDRFDEKVDKINDRVAELEKMRWWAMGAVAVIIFLITLGSFDLMQFLY